MTRESAPDALVVKPIGFVRSPFTDKADAPRQAVTARDVAATIELLPGMGFEDALCDLASFDHLWVVYWFHLNEGWRPKVLPPRSASKRGVFATRAPHRPNPIGMSAVGLVSIEGLTLHIRGADMVDRTPVLDIKPYVAYADAISHASEGWLADPVEPYSVRFEGRAEEALVWLEKEHAVGLRAPIEKALSLGPEPHAYRRIRRDGPDSLLAHKAWRARFRVVERAVTVQSIESGYRTRDLTASNADPEREPDLALHRAFLARFG